MIGGKRNCSTLAGSDHNLHPKRPKLSSNFVKTCIGDLPDSLLVEILCRLPCKEAFQCKLVSRSWCNILSDLYFIGRFLCLQSETPIKQHQVNKRGEEVFTFSEILTRMFERLMSFHSLKEKPIVVATYNDLVLCCATVKDQRNYYICNPYTTKWVSLPPPPTIYKNHVPVGLVCDCPYYDNDHKKDKDIIQVNGEFRCKVVRIPPFEDRGEYGTFEFKVEIFSFETGDWRESIVSSPEGFSFNDICCIISFIYNGMLCWPSKIGADHTFIIGLDLFTKEDRNGTSIGTTGDNVTDHYECCFFRLAVENEMLPWLVTFLGVSQGCPRMGYLSGHSLYVWELKEAKDQMVSFNRAGKLSLIHPSIHSLDQNMFQDEYHHKMLLHFDPDGKDILYLRLLTVIYDVEFIKCNINTGEWSRIDASEGYYGYFFSLIVLPWPTPVPRLQQHAHSGESNSTYDAGQNEEEEMQQQRTLSKKQPKWNFQNWRQIRMNFGFRALAHPCLSWFQMLMRILRPIRRRTSYPSQGVIKPPGYLRDFVSK